MRSGVWALLDRHSVDVTGRPALQYLYVTLGFFFVLLSAGTIFGWSSLLLVLQAEGVYSELCANSTSTVAVLPSPTLDDRLYALQRTLLEGPKPVGMCTAQALRFDLVFLLGLLSVFLPTPFHGWLMDRFGARVSNAFSALLILIGFIIFAFGYHTTRLDLITPGLMFFGAGGTGTALAMFPLARIKQEYISIILAFYNVGYDSSPIVFYVYVKLYQAFAVTPKTFFLSFCAVPILSLILSVFWPKGYGEPASQNDKEVTQEARSCPKGLAHLQVIPSDMTEPTEDTASHESLPENDNAQVELELDTPMGAGDASDVAGQAGASGQKASADTSEVMLGTQELTPAGETSELGPTDLYGLPFLEQLLTRASVLACLFHTIFSFWLSTYMGSIQSRLNSIEPASEANAAKINRYTESFGLVLSLAFLMAPFIGFAIHKLKLVRAIFVATGLGIAWSLCQFLPTVNLQIITFIVFALLRAWYYSIAFNTVSQLFGWTNVGKIWGMYSAFAGIITIGFYGISWSVVHMFKGSYTAPNVLATVTITSTLTFGLFLLQRKRKWELAQMKVVPVGAN